MRSSSGVESRKRRPKANEEQPETTTAETTETQETPSRSDAVAASAASSDTRPQPAPSAEVMPEEIPPSPAQVSQQEATQADAERDLARAERPSQRNRADDKQREQVKARKKRVSKIPGKVVVVAQQRTVYVDEDGAKLPDIGPDMLRPVVMVGSRVVESMGMRPFDEGEITTLSDAWAPVAHKYAGWLLPYMTEAMAFGALLVVMWPRVRERDEAMKRERAMANVKAAQEPKKP